jgi:hypothetical protein
VRGRKIIENHSQNMRKRCTAVAAVQFFYYSAVWLVRAKKTNDEEGARQVHKSNLAIMTILK